MVDSHASGHVFVNCLLSNSACAYEQIDVSTRACQLLPLELKGSCLLDNTKSVHVQQLICMSQPAGLADCRGRNSPQVFGSLTNESLGI